MCCWILQGRLLRKNDFEPVYSQTLFHICTQNPPLPRTKPPPRLIYVVKMFNAKKRPKCSVVRCKAVHCRQHPLVGTQTNICRNQEQISREIKNRFLEKSRKDFWRNQEQISGEIQKRFLQKFEEKVFAPRSQLHVSPTTSALSTKCLFGINCLTLTLFLLMEVLLLDSNLEPVRHRDSETLHDQMNKVSASKKANVLGVHVHITLYRHCKIYAFFPKGSLKHCADAVT